jgi:hypothetical protein
MLIFAARERHKQTIVIPFVRAQCSWRFETKISFVIALRTWKWKTVIIITYLSKRKIRKVIIASVSGWWRRRLRAIMFLKFGGGDGG